MDWTKTTPSRDEIHLELEFGVPDTGDFIVYLNICFHSATNIQDGLVHAIRSLGVWWFYGRWKASMSPG